MLTAEQHGYQLVHCISIEQTASISIILIHIKGTTIIYRQSDTYDNTKTQHLITTDSWSLNILLWRVITSWSH